MLSALWFGRLESNTNHSVLKTEFRADGTVVSYPVPAWSVPKPEEETGSGMGLRPHLKLGPRNNSSRTPPVEQPTNPGHNPPTNDNTAPPVVVNPDDPEPEPPPASPAWNVNITFVNQTDAEKVKQNKAASEIEAVMNNETAAFKAQVLAHVSYYGSVGFYGSCSPCASSCELGNVNLAVWNKMWNGNETLINVVDNEMDLTVEMYYTDNSTIGYTYANQNKIWANRKFHDGYRADQVAGNFFHEWLHKLGYGHSSSSTSCRPYSVPYAVGYMMRERCFKYN